MVSVYSKLGNGLVFLCVSAFKLFVLLVKGFWAWASSKAEKQKQSVVSVPSVSSSVPVSQSNGGGSVFKARSNTIFDRQPVLSGSGAREGKPNVFGGGFSSKVFMPQSTIFSKRVGS